MSCAAIMTRNPITLVANESVGDAAGKLMAHRFASLPVVDAEGRFIGMFGLTDFLSLLVPRVALAGDLQANLRFIGDDPAALRSRYLDVKSRSIGDAADRAAATVNPDTPEIEAVRHFCQSHNSLAVIEPETRELVGVISCWDAIGTLSGPLGQ